jgi:hypothetical protein
MQRVEEAEQREEAEKGARRISGSVRGNSRFLKNTISIAPFMAASTGTPGLTLRG